MVRATAVGLAFGVGYAASPLTVWFFVFLVGLFAWAGRDLTPRERRWVWSLLAAAVAVRLVAVVLLFLSSDPSHLISFFWDGDGIYLKQRGLWIRNVWLDVPIAPQDFDAAFSRLYGWTTYLYVIAYLQYWLGAAPYAIHLMNIALYLAASVVLYRLVRSSFGRVSAFCGLALLLFVPTLLFWSVSALKESLYLFLLVMGVASMVAIARGPGLMTRAIAAMALAMSVATIDGVRSGGSVILAAALGAGLAGGVIMRRSWVAVLVLALLPYAGYRILNNGAVQARIWSQLHSAASQHIGHVRTEGHGYKLLDQRFYVQSPPVDTMTPAEGLRFVVRGLVSFVVVPLPWQVQSATEMMYLPQQVVWYVLVVLAAVGVVAGLRRDPFVTCMFVGMTIAGAAAVAINSGNIGTMVRHRDTVVPFIVWFSAVGGVATMWTWKSRGTSKVAVRAPVS